MTTTRPAKSAHARARLDALEPGDLRLRHGMGYQWVRRSVLTIAWVLVVAVPLLHAATFECESQGLFGAPLAGHVPAPASLAHGLIGAPTSLAIGPLALVDPLAGLVVLLTDVRADTVVIPHGWDVANANELIDAGQRDPISGFPAFRYGVCRLRKT